MSSLRVSQLAERAGVGIDTVRYYERAGLIPEPPRRASGYREYPAQAVERLRFIRRAKALGFTLEEIAGLLTLSDQRADAQDVRQLAVERLEQIETKLRELQRMRDGLRQLVDACPGHGDSEACPILSALNDGATP
ncbi:heavy metal-responsive transcriptional regulator [Sinimarinibacterium sp. CAU 1509]|uniref:heavy metal-responsive transcriptional regulator n=1 Tax=Sinimarinibacterium sp. CAU 1509 TaxID=2562283 RepID=UPI0010ABB090|nr:heavy metal-responsive transcriptional regulator [Sinimarinibacterium sp. CAU 1509]TJY62026.1 heavy metal-responsive transcriptional regulator [Sinimarinibacterium sp. CAU 1509]